jgi:hypothetical protein
MRNLTVRPSRAHIFLALFAVSLLAGPARAQESPSKAEKKDSAVVRIYGTESGYRTEVSSKSRGMLNDEDRRQVGLLTAQVFRHIDEARRALDAEDIAAARTEVEKGRRAIETIRAVLPKVAVHTRTLGPDGEVSYEDEREVQDDRVPLFEGMLHEQTLAPIIAAKQDAIEVAGVRLVDSATITTQAVADLGFVEAQLGRAFKALERKEVEAAFKALAVAQVRGVELFASKEDSPLAEARDAMWLTRRALEENNAAQARANLEVARQRLRLYREVAPKDRQTDVDRMGKEIDQLEVQLRQETAQQPASHAERSRQGNVVTQWWEQVNRWFRQRF